MAGIKRRQLAAEDRAQPTATLGDLANHGRGVDVFCWCNRCGHNAVVPTARLALELGPDFPVPEVGTRMRCSGCGSKDVATRPAWPSLGLVASHR
jgi:hypothetical protein